MIKVEALGLDALERHLNAAPKAAQDAAQAQGAKAASSIVSDMRARAPVDRGDLRASIRSEPARDGGMLVRAGGTETTMKPNAGGGSFDEAVAVEYGGAHNPAEPYFNPTIEAHRQGAERDMGKAADDAAGKAVP